MFTKVSMEDYIPSEDGPFRNSLWCQRNLSLGAVPRWSYRWVKLGDLLSSLWEEDGHAVYFLMRDEFVNLCKQHHLPRHNAIAFWQYLLDHKDEIDKNDPLLLYCLICEGACSFGDYFMDVFVRNLPRDFVWPKDIIEEELSEVRQKFERDVSQENIASPERSHSLERFNQFTQEWNQQINAAQRCHAWIDRYHALNICELETREFLGDDHTIHALAHILRQYVLMLNEAPNSKQPKLEDKWNELHQSRAEKRLCETSDLFCSLERMAGLLESVPEIALIAPIYVLALFREQLSNLFNGKITSINKLSAEQILHSNPVKLYKNTGNPHGTPKNTYFRRDAQLATYQILCDYFQNNHSFLCTPCDKEMCDYMLQKVLPLVGELYFDIKPETSANIATTGKYICLECTKQTSKWIHPLLQEIDARKIPHIVNADNMGFNLVQWIGEGTTLVDKNPDFLDRYLNILVLADGGIGNPELSDSAKTAFADLLDEALVNSESVYIKELCKELCKGADDWQDDPPNRNEDLYALETGAHSACASILLQRYKTKILLFLYEYFQSASFCVGAPIPTDQLAVLQIPRN